MTAPDLNRTTLGVLQEVSEERSRQDAKWGEQNHPDGTSREYEMAANHHKQVCDTAAKQGKLTYAHILTEEFYEALAEEDEDKLRVELLQTAAVTVAWIECIDRRKKARENGKTA